MATDFKGSAAAGSVLGAATDRRAQNQANRKEVLSLHEQGKSLKDIYIATGMRPRRIRRIIGRLKELEEE